MKVETPTITLAEGAMADCLTTDNETARIQELHEQLRSACAEFGKPTPDFDLNPKADHPQREAVVKALMALMNYARPVLDPAALALPIVRLIGAIADIDNGVPHAMLTPRKAPGGRPRSNEAGQYMATACAAVDLYLRAGMSLNDALATVARCVRPKRVTPRQLGSWREKLRQGKRGAFALDQYWKRLNEAEQWAPGNPADAADVLLTVLSPPSDDEETA